MKNPYKEGDKVKYTDGDPRTFTVYAIYSPTTLSLAIYRYPDTEQDYIIDIDKIKPAKNK